jgi:hypothetical protein
VLPAGYFQVGQYQYKEEPTPILASQCFLMLKAWYTVIVNMKNSYLKFLLGFMAILAVSMGVTLVVDRYAAWIDAQPAQVEGARVE